MTEVIIRPDAPLTGSTIAILMESDYVEPELHYYQRRFAEEGAQTVFLTRLWGQQQMTFHGHEFQLPFTVNGDLEAVTPETLRTFDALIVPSGMVSDRLGTRRPRAIFRPRCNCCARPSPNREC